ncbi:ESX secretion-associated protein EspG [Nocardia takedensis]|uniref:ESX secretion-associated protein EspG n=1 Tax=Nocardia takedensis TaxID=259390 RepID=UPI00030F94E9|nr:ESX secretion-associated protein EspG [Nocardia takedensis]
MNWTLTPDQFALAWERTDGDRIPYPLAVRLSARDSTERAAQLPGLIRWCDRVLDADLEAALRVLARPTVRLEVYGEGHPALVETPDPVGLGAEIVAETRILGMDTAAAEPGRGRASAVGAAARRESTGRTSDDHAGNPGYDTIVRGPDSLTDFEPGDAATTDRPPVRVLGAAAGHIAVVAAQCPGVAPDRGGDIRLSIGGPKSLAARVVSMLPGNRAGGLPRLTAPAGRVREDSRDLVTVPVAGPSAPARIRRLLASPREGIGQIVVSTRRADGDLRPFGVLCWIDVLGDGRYAVRTGADVDLAPVDGEGFTAHLRPMLNAAGRSGADAQRW